MKFADILGHADAKARLMSLVDSGKIPHAMLLEGPAGSGKFALARALAQYIHCEHRIQGVDSCGKCPACIQESTFNHADTIFSYPIVKRGSGKPAISDDYISEFKDLISESIFMDFEQWLVKLDNINAQPAIYVDEANELVRRLSYSSSTSKYKIVLIWLPERFNADTANKLLKLVEEPFDDTIFIMASDNSRLILPTIYSRLQRITIKRYAIDDIACHLSQAYGVNGPDACRIAQLADGSMTKAIGLISISKERKIYLDMFMALMRHAYSRKVADLKAWASDLAALGREREMRFFDYCGHMIRENFILNAKVPELTLLNADEMQFSAKFSPFINERNVVKLFGFVNDAKADIASNGNAKLVNFDMALKTMMLIRS